MAKTLNHQKMAFLHWESHPSHARQRLTPTQEVKAGDVLILTASGYEPYRGSKLTPKADAKAQEPVVAVALADGKANEATPCVVRSAVLVQEQLNHVAANAFASSQPLEALLPHFARQSLQVRPSIALSKAVE